MTSRLSEEKRELLSEQIRRTLSDEITAGLLAAGASLDEQQLADRFGASRTPVREALRQLATSGLVEIRPHRGGVVARLTPERIMEMFEVSAEVEALCVRLATNRITPLERGRLATLHGEAAQSVACGDVDRYDTCNHAFHDALYAATHNGFLSEQAKELRGRLDAFRRAQLRDEGRITASHAEHATILVAMAEGDSDAASRRMRAHMLNAASALTRYVAERSKEAVLS
jgi:DNA-binding GntR family transcriptional regulator